VVAAVSRFLDWFWVLSAEREVRARSGEHTTRTLECIGRAALAHEAAVRTERPAEPFHHGSGEAIACELYREAIHWALLAHAELAPSPRVAEPAAAPAAEAKAEASPATLAKAAERVSQSLLAEAAGGTAELAALRPRLSESYREFAELTPAAQRALATELARFAKGLLDPLASLQQKLERIWVRRVVHVLGALVVLVVLGLVGRSIVSAREREADLAPRATWTISSTYPSGGCKSPEQRCAGGESYFFHTGNEANPWIQFDLGRDRRISSVEVENRLDCCADRAMPLVFEVSTDQKRWTEVGRVTREFSTYRQRFKAVKTRYVRLRVAQPSAILHLSRVRIFP
jgi:hypothetical protein